MQATCSSCSNVVTVDENNPKLPAGPFSVKCPKCQTPVRFQGRGAKADAPKPAEAAPRPVEPAPAGAPPASAVPIKPTALPGERALVALDDKQRASDLARSLMRLGYEVDVTTDTEGVRALEQGAHAIVAMARTVAEGGSLTSYQRLFLVPSDLRRQFFLILVGDEYTTGDGVQAFVVHGDLVVASPDAGSCETVVRERLIERSRLFRVFVEAKRKHDAAPV
jgi:CheY-like chemotaxis protein